MFKCQGTSKRYNELKDDKTKNLPNFAKSLVSWKHLEVCMPQSDGEWTLWLYNTQNSNLPFFFFLQVNEVGKLFLSLKAEWSTPPIEYDLSEPVKDFSVFLGEYRVFLTKLGQTIWKKSLKIEQARTTTTLVIGYSEEQGIGE